MPLNNFGQGENNNWFFGFGGGISFNNIDGSVDPNSIGQTLASEGVSAISSSSGELLFYTDGGTIYNRLHQIMQNGTDLFGTEASTQSSAIVPLPQNPNIYYVFTVDATSPNGIRGRGLNYSIVDISRDNGNGAVIQKNINLLPDCTEKIAVTIGSCIDEVLWIVTVATPTGAWNPTPPFPIFNTYHAFRMDANGVNPVSVTSTFPINVQADQGYLTFSPDGNKLANANYRGGLFLSDFDKVTGVVSNLEQIITPRTTNPNFPYGVAFSPNSQLLYAHSTRKRPGVEIFDSALLQYNMSSPDVALSELVIDEREQFRGSLQLGTNGRIYRTLSRNFSNDYITGTPLENGLTYLGVINDPGEIGLASNYQHNAVEIQGNRVRQGLPALVQSFFTELEIVSETGLILNDIYNFCVGDPVVLQAQLLPGASYTWSKDGIVLPNVTTNIVEIPSANLVDSGNYSVNILRPGAMECPVTGEITIQVNAIPLAEDINLTVCDSDADNVTDGFTNINLELAQENTSFAYSFYESISDLTNDLAIQRPADYRNISPFTQTLYYKIVSDNGCEDTGQLVLEVIEPPTITMEETYSLCLNNPNLELSAPTGFSAYRWYKLENNTKNLVASGQEVVLLEAGNYIIEVDSMTNSNNSMNTVCSSRTEFSVLGIESPVISEISITEQGIGKVLEVIVTGNGIYEFSLDNNIFQDSNIFTDLATGTYTIFVRDKNGCGTIQEAFEVRDGATVGNFPIFFTPNGDGINDFWQYQSPSITTDVMMDIIEIYDRFGFLVATIGVDSPGWDGNIRGKNASNADYWYRAMTADGRIFVGHFALKR